jgi:hypothetical protein
MTQTAKYLVFGNLILAVVFMAWAVGLFTNQVPWPTPKPDEGPKVEGLVAQLQAQIKTLADSSNTADQTWGESYVQVQGVEKRRADAQKYYTDLLKSIRTGNVPDIKPPVQQLAFNGPTLDIAKRNGRSPVTVNNENALSVGGYHVKIQQTLTDIQTAQTDIARLITESENLTKQINGVSPQTPQTPTLAEKGLRVQIREQQEMAHNLWLEEQFLRSPLTYYTLQREQLRQRQAALSGRLGELGAATTAAAR